MEDLCSKTHQNMGTHAKLSEGVQDLDNRTPSAHAWSNSLNESARQPLSAEPQDSALLTPLTEPSLGLFLKTATSLLQPVCLGASPVVVPGYLQGVPGGADTPVIAPGTGSLTLPLILDQPGLRYSRSQLLLQSSCLMPEQQHMSGAEQNCGPSQNPSMPLSQTQHIEGKPDPALHCSEFSTVLQEPFPVLRNCGSSACQGTRSVPSNSFSTSLSAQDAILPYLYTGLPLVSLVPPATLLVPYPLIVPLPVPLPIPVPIPVPFPDSKVLSGPSCAASTTKKNKGTQTTVNHNRNSDCRFLQLLALPTPSVSQQEVLDLRIKVAPVRAKQEAQFSLLQDSALDLSVAKQQYLESCSGNKLKCHENSSTNAELAERITSPIKHSQGHEPDRLHNHSNIDFGVQCKWTMEDCFTKSIEKSPGRAVSPLQAPAVFCKKLVRQPQEHMLTNRVVRLKRVTSRNMNIYPIKKQHVVTFIPGK
ncbi:retinoic acid-induced protein 2-like [Salminus brasiliensis]|uniref:retinoic acid-induced protein 2-like n=1 Tax=Salminus brasiliensis TaxID=930266 RepID=UPI003B8320DD